MTNTVQLPYKRHLDFITVQNKTPQTAWLWGFIGTPSGARTLDTLIKSQVLYQLS